MALYTAENTVKAISVADLIHSYRDGDRFMKYCRQCPNYDTVWSCPSLDFDPEAYLNQYENALIIGTKINYTEEALQKSLKKAKMNQIMGIVMKDARTKISERLWQAEKSLGGWAIFPGGCILCNTCARTNGEACRHPEQMRYSLDSFGMDLSRLATELLGIELKWAKDCLPAYHTLITAFLYHDAKSFLISSFAEMR